MGRFKRSTKKTLRNKIYQIKNCINIGVVNIVGVNSFGLDLGNVCTAPDIDLKYDTKEMTEIFKKLTLGEVVPKIEPKIESNEWTWVLKVGQSKIMKTVGHAMKIQDEYEELVNVVGSNHAKIKPNYYYKENSEFK